MESAPYHRITILIAAGAPRRLEAARRAIEQGLTTGEALLVGHSREAADDLAREISLARGATFGLHRFSVRQLASRIAAVDLARGGLAPARRLGAEAVATRAAFEETEDEPLEYLQPIARLRSFGRTLASTLHDLRHAGIAVEQLRELGAGGRDLERLARRYARQLGSAGLVDSAALLRVATDAVPHIHDLPLERPLVLVDVAVPDEATFEFVSAIAARAASVFATVPAGDVRTAAALRRLPGAVASADPEPSSTPLDRVRHFLFAADDPPPDDTPEDAPTVTFFSAPGEGREAVEIARLVLAESARGIRFDDMAVLLRSSTAYAGVVETALARAGAGAWFAKGTRVPDPAGRAFLALLSCAAERLSARRFSEYLSLAQVPRLDADGAPPTDRGRWVAPDGAEEVVPAPALPAQLSLLDMLAGPDESVTASDVADDDDDEPVLAGALRAPARWDRLLVESAVINGRDRWERRLNGLAREWELKREELRTEDAESPRLNAIADNLRNLEHLRRFALPVIDRLSEFSDAASWGDWLDRLGTLAPMVLEKPDRVLAVLGELRPMARVGPVRLAEVRHVLNERLTELQTEPPRRRFGRVFVGSPEHVRGRRFAVVFVPGLAERVFPQKQRQDPLLLDDRRETLNGSATASDHLGLPDRHDLNAEEQLLLRLAIGAATDRVHLSYPRLQLDEARPRVPSFYALDVERARTGRVPHFRVLERRAFRQADARLAWPAPPEADHAIDDTEHDLGVLGPLLHRTAIADVTGRARYLLRLDEALRRSLTARWARWQKPRNQPRSPWSRHDGLYDVSDETKALLAAHRLDARPYSVSSLQRFATCPYKFLLASIYRLQPREEVEPIERMDPLTRGRMFHEVQAEFVRALQRRDALPVTVSRLGDAEAEIDAVLNRVATQYQEDLAPAIDRVWCDEVEAMRSDLKGWLHHVANEDGAWIPIRAEFGFGFAPGGGRDPESVADPVTLDGRWRLHGVVDLIEAKAGPTPRGELRVTDHKTGRNRTRERMVVGGGEVLQPVLYGLAVEASMDRAVGSSQLFFCTSTGGFEKQVVTLGERERRQGIEVLEIVDRAVEAGMLIPAPRAGACRWCDFREVCGPWEEKRAADVKDQTKLVDLQALRRLP